MSTTNVGQVEQVVIAPKPRRRQAAGNLPAPEPVSQVVTVERRVLVTA